MTNTGECSELSILQRENFPFPATRFEMISGDDIEDMDSLSQWLRERTTVAEQTHGGALQIWSLKAQKMISEIKRLRMVLTEVAHQADRALVTGDAHFHLGNIAALSKNHCSPIDEHRATAELSPQERSSPSGAVSLSQAEKINPVLAFLNKVEGHGYGGMAEFEIARSEAEDLVFSTIERCIEALTDRSNEEENPVCEFDEGWESGMIDAKVCLRKFLCKSDQSPKGGDLLLRSRGRGLRRRFAQMTPEICEDCGEEHDPDPLGEAVDDVADLIISLRFATYSRLKDAGRFHDMLRERLLAEERLH